MDLLKVGDEVEVRTYNTDTEEVEWIKTTVSEINVCSDGGKFAHGGFHSVWAKVNGFLVPLESELTR